MKSLNDLLYRLRKDMNGVPLEDIPDHLNQVVSILLTLSLARIQDLRVLKPLPIFFACADQLKHEQVMPLAVLDACDQGNSARAMISAGKARLVDNPIVGQMLVVH